MNEPTRFRAIHLGAVLLVLLGTVGCDQATKHFARTGLSQLAPRHCPVGSSSLRLLKTRARF
jgi:hypothetical protein